MAGHAGAEMAMLMREEARVDRSSEKGHGPPCGATQGGARVSRETGGQKERRVARSLGGGKEWAGQRGRQGVRWAPGCGGGPCLSRAGPG